MEGALQSGVAQQRNVEDVVQVHEDLVPESKVKANQQRLREIYGRMLGCKAMEDGKAGKTYLFTVSILLPTTKWYLHLFSTDAFGVGGLFKTINELSIN